MCVSQIFWSMAIFIAHAGLCLFVCLKCILLKIICNIICSVTIALCKAFWSMEFTGNLGNEVQQKLKAKWMDRLIVCVVLSTCLWICVSEWEKEQATEQIHFSLGITLNHLFSVTVCDMSNQTTDIATLQQALHFRVCGRESEVIPVIHIDIQLTSSIKCHIVCLNVVLSSIVPLNGIAQCEACITTVAVLTGNPKVNLKRCPPLDLHS